MTRVPQLREGFLWGFQNPLADLLVGCGKRSRRE